MVGEHSEPIPALLLSEPRLLPRADHQPDFVAGNHHQTKTSIAQAVAAPRSIRQSHDYLVRPPSTIYGLLLYRRRSADLQLNYKNPAVFQRYDIAAENFDVDLVSVAVEPPLYRGV